jgi:hypothetical protein
LKDLEDICHDGISVLGEIAHVVAKLLSVVPLLCWESE